MTEKTAKERFIERITRVARRLESGEYTQRTQSVGRFIKTKKESTDGKKTND